MKILQICLEASLPDRIAAADRRLLKQNGHRVIYFEKNIREMNKFPVVQSSQLGSGSYNLGNSYHIHEYLSQIKSYIQKQKPNVIHIYNTALANFSDLYETCRRLGGVVIQNLDHYELLCPRSILFYSNKLCKTCLQKSLLKEDAPKKCLRDNQLQSADLTKMITDYWSQKAYRDKVDYYVVPTDFFRLKLIEYGLPQSKIGVKPEFYDELPAEPIETGDYALFVGKLTEESGLKTLLKACASLPAFRLLILGDGPLKNEVIEMCSHYPNVEFLGWQSKEDCLRYQAQALFLVFPTESYDSFPSIIVRSYALGVPVMASNMGGIGCLVLDGVTGCLFPPGDDRVLAEKIDRLWQDRHLLSSMRENAKTEHEGKYTSEKNYQILINLYQEALSRKKKIVKERSSEFKHPAFSKYCLK